MFMQPHFFSSVSFIFILTENIIHVFTTHISLQPASTYLMTDGGYKALMHRLHTQILFYFVWLMGICGGYYELCLHTFLE